MLNKLIIRYFVLFLLSFNVLFGAEVTKDKALDYAVLFGTKYMKLTSVSVKNIEALTLNDSIYSWVINFNPSGWVLIASDDKVKPVIAFSFENSFQVEGLKKLPFNFWFEKNIGRQVLQAKQRKDLLRDSRWDSKFMLKSTSVSVAPIIKVSWDQGNGWNAMCPADGNGPGGHTYVGCVAVAMAQAMSVYKHPATGTGTYGYNSSYGYLSANFGSTAYLWDSMSFTSPNKFTALLLYHAGVSVEMDYGADGSGALSSRVPSALKKYFGYSTDVAYRNKSAYTDDQWITLIQNEINAGRPVYYSGDPGTGASGHAFNIDGYFDNSFHFNWGWSGHYNGYFFLSALNPGGNDFSVNQAAVFGIGLTNNPPTDILLSKTIITEGLPVNSFVGKITVVDKSPIDSFSYKLHGPWSPVFDDYAISPFFIRNDSLLSSEVFSYSVDNYHEVFIKATDKEGNTIEKRFVISIQKSSSSGIQLIINTDFSNCIYPNPVGEVLHFSCMQITQPVSVSIFDLEGSKQLEHEGVVKDGISVRGLKSGVYIVKLMYLGKVYEGKIIKQ